MNTTSNTSQIQHKNPIHKKLFKSNPSHNTSNTSKKPSSVYPFGLSNDDTIQKIQQMSSRVSFPQQFYSIPKNQSNISSTNNNNQPSPIQGEKRKLSFQKKVKFLPNEKDQKYLTKYLDQVLNQNSMLMKKLEQKDYESNKMQIKYSQLQQRYHRLLQSIYIQRRHFCPTCQDQKRLSTSQISNNSKASRANSAKSIETKRRLSQLKRDLDKLSFPKSNKTPKLPKYKKLVTQQKKA